MSTNEEIGIKINYGQEMIYENLFGIPVSLKTAPEGNYLERFRETATIIKRKVTVRTRKLIARGSILYKNSDKEYLQQQNNENDRRKLQRIRKLENKNQKNWNAEDQDNFIENKDHEPVSLKTAPEGNYLERFRETATIIKRKVTVRTRKLIARGSILYKNSDKEYLQQQKKLERRRPRQLYREQRPRVNLNQVLEEINWNIRSRENSLTRSPVSFSVQTSVETTRENSPEQSNDEESGSELSEREFQERVREFENYRTRTIEEARRSRRSRRNKKLERRRPRQLYREQRPRVNLNQVLEEINWNIRSRENSLTRSPVSFSVQTSVETTRENSPEQSNDEESGSELSEREFQERVREFENYRTRTIEEARRSRRSRRNSNNNQPLEIVEEENIEEQELGGLREYLQEFEIEIEQEENNEEPIVENNIMDILALRSKKFRGDGTQDPVEWLKNYEKTARMNGWTDDQKKERIYTVLDDAADEWYNEIYTATYGDEENG
ncbi:hypothetical protein Glove_457g25 [Diversispora epigaea]|uniref:Uncharacterized protein n=1 Tax=Diversispora epigaea TaxID=1348612 RepID=A0A397GUR4_9GLOM|nr:hypothetical protein Glove_457g25 [Diversispora epigaea]